MLPAQREGLSLAAWADALLARVSITLVPVEARASQGCLPCPRVRALPGVDGAARRLGCRQVPDARRAVEAGQLCRRKSLAEVDLNRNWGVAWRAGAPRGGDEYGGGVPFSEPQSRALRRLATEEPPTAYANVHSGEWALYVPWDHKKVRRKAHCQAQRGPQTRRLAFCSLFAVQALAEGMPADTDALLETLNTHCKARPAPLERGAFSLRCVTRRLRAPQCTRGAGGAASNYLAFGTSMDWMWQGAHPSLIRPLAILPIHAPV